MPSDQKTVAAVRKQGAAAPPGEEGESDGRLSGASRDYLRMLFARAAELMGADDDAELREFFVLVFQLSELYRAFRTTSRGAVGGRRGVAAQLGVSRSAVYLWLDSLELTPEDFRAANSLIDLMHGSRKLKKTIRKLLPPGLTIK